MSTQNPTDGRDVIADFWRGIDTHDWELIGSTLADDFVRIGMRNDEADTCRGKENYLQFVEQVIAKMDHHELKSRRTFRSEDGRRVLNEAVETIHPPGEEPLTMYFANVMELNDDGLIAKLDIYWKTPPRMPPSWIAVASVLSEKVSGQT
jgi:SnoaL-like domain